MKCLLDGEAYKLIDAVDVMHELSQVRNHNSKHEVWDDLWVSDFISSYPGELKRLADEDVEIVA